VRLLRTIRLDASDTFVFEKAAEPGEWAVSGAFAFWDGNPSQLEGKMRAAFRSGFLGISTFGWSTLVQIVDATDEDRRAAVAQLAQNLVSHFGAPTRDAAAAAAEEEIAFAQSLCDQPRDMLVAVHRVFEEGAVRESFRTLRPRGGPRPARAFSFFEVEGDDNSKDAKADNIDSNSNNDDVDLIGLVARDRQ